MAGKKLNIEKPDLRDIKKELYNVGKTALPIVEGKLEQKLPDKLQPIADKILDPPSPADIIREKLFKIPEKKVPPKPVKKNLDMPDHTDPAEAMGFVSGSAISGDPIYSNLEVTSQSYTAFDGTTQKFPDMQFTTVLIKCKQHKNIVETAVQGSENGSVFEYSGLNNYDIDISLTVTYNQNGIYPKKVMGDIVKLCESQVSIKVNSWYLQMLNIYEIVIVDYDISQEPGGISQQNVNITAKSNKRATLIIQ